MKIEKSQEPGKPPRIVLICESDHESDILDSVFGKQIGEDGLISETEGQVKLSGGYAEHYIQLQAT